MVERSFAVAVMALVLSVCPVDALAQPVWIPEGDLRVTQPDGTMELTGGGGWLRLNEVFSDFRLEFDFLLRTASSTAFAPFA